MAVIWNWVNIVNILFILLKINNMKNNWKSWIKNIALVLSLFFIGMLISGNYDYAINDDGFLFSISFVIIMTFLWKKINNKFFK